MPVLIVSDGAGERQINLDKPRFTIGKRPGNDLVLGDIKISREHCEILSTDAGFVLRDLQSRNGSFVDGARVMDEAPLRDGSAIQLASSQLTFSEALVKDSIAVRRGISGRVQPLAASESADSPPSLIAETL